MECATTLSGAVDSLLSATGFRLYPIDRAEYDSSVTTGRNMLGEAAFSAAYVRGAAMSFEQAVRYALDEVVGPGAAGAGAL